MKKLILALILFSSSVITHAQKSDAKIKKDFSTIDLSNRANDHFMLQYGIDGWSGTNDSINTSGFSRHFNFYLLFDKPFKTNPKYSLAYGLGLGSANIFFSNTYIDLKSTTTTLPFKNVASSDRFNKYKLTTLFLEAPIEFRYVSNPVQPDKGMKAAIGIKAGTLLSAHTKGKDLTDSTGQSIYGGTYISKEYNRRFLNTARFAVTGRIGLGNISLDGSYQVTGFLKQGTGPIIRPWAFGLTLSGL